MATSERFLPIRLFVGVSAIVLSIATAYGENKQPSFDCKKAKTTSERTVCSDTELAQLDRELSSIYEKGLEAGAVDKASQLAWIKHRDAACLPHDSKNCLRSQMQERIAELRQAILRNAKPSVGQPQPASSGASLASEPTNAEGLLRPMGSAGDFHPISDLRVLDHHLLFAEFDPSGNAKQVVSIDPATGKSKVVAAHLQQPLAPAVLFADPHVTVLVELRSKSEGGNELEIFDTSTAMEWRQFNIGSEPDTATVIGQRLYVATVSKQFPPRLRLDIFDLFPNSQIASREIWNVPDHSRPVFWKGKIILVAPGSLTLYDERLDRIASSAAPADQSYGSGGCGVVQPQIFGARLIYQISCGHIVIFDLDHFILAHEFERFDPSAFVSLDVAGNLLFAVPIGEGRRPNNGTVFDLTSGRRIAVLPLTADAFAVSGDALAALASTKPGDPNTARRASLYRVQQDELSAPAQQRALEKAHTGALAIMTRSRSFDDAVYAMESAATDRLFDVDAAHQELQTMAIDYASWLAGTFDRRTAGIKLLGGLVAAGPTDHLAMRRLGAALLRDYLLTGSPANLDRAQHLLSNEPNLATFQLPSIPMTRSTPIDFDYFRDRVAFWHDKIVIGRSPGSDKPPSVAVYDRTTLKPLWSRDFPASEKEGAITSIAFEGDRILLWLLPNNSDLARVAIIDALSHNLILRSTPSAFGTVLRTANGLVGCVEPLESTCTIVDLKTFKGKGRFECDAMNLVDRDSADDEALSKLVGSGCQTGGQGQLVALGKRWMLMASGSWPGPYGMSYRRVADTGGWHSSELHLMEQGGSNAKISDERDAAVIDNRQPELNRFIWLDFKTGAYRTMLQVRDRREAEVAWTIAGSLLIVGMGHDLILYDTVNNCMAGILHNVIPTEAKDNRNAIDKAKIARLLVDGPRLIVLTLDGRYSRMLQMRDVVNYAEKAVQNFKLVDAMLEN